MCFETDAHPPMPPIRGSALDAIDVTLTTADNTKVAAYEVHAAEPTGAGIVICPDVRGLHPFYKELALRFAEAGVDAIAFDYFSRTAGTGKRDGRFEYMPHVGQVRIETLDHDVAAAAAQLRGDRQIERLYTVGFCFGGRVSFLQARRPELELSGVIGFYGVPAGSHRSGIPAPVDEVPQFTCPVLGLFGGADQGISPETRDAFERALSAAGIDHRIVVYPGAPHSFFDRSFEEHADASADAWREVLAFMGVTGPAAS
jgi:carboxymethylenebutenolidase